MLIGGLITASFALEGLGHVGLSWGADGVAVLVFVAARIARRRLQRRATT